MDLNEVMKGVGVLESQRSKIYYAVNKALAEIFK